MIYFKIFLLALALYIFLRFTWSHLPILLENKKVKPFILRLFPVLEFFVWVGFIIWSSSLLFGSFAAYSFIMAFVVVIILIILAWYLLRDLVSGFILRSENGFEPGQVIKTSFVQGTIKKVSYRSIEIITSNGEYVKIPYTMLITTAVIKPQDNSKWVENIINLEVSTALDAAKVMNLLKNRLLEMPWIVSEESIKIEFKVQSQDPQDPQDPQGSQSPLTHYCANIHFYSITPETAIKTEENLKLFIEESVNG